MVYGSSRTPRARSPSCAGARSSSPASPSVPGALACLPGLPGTFSLAHPDNEGSRRAALADWLASPRNMLTWRSIANRLWHYHFGRGIVETPNDFGRNGARPTHPELLDWLAVELRDNGQSLKALHRLIVCSAVYRQASRDNPAFAAIDADNRYLWRQNRRRLDAEAIRDSVLAVAGTLDRRMGGPGFELFLFKDDHSPIYDHTDPAKVDNPQVRRRTVYRFIVRSVPNPFMEALDCADPNINTPVRSQTLTALQALALWNDLFMVREAQEFARRLEKRSPEPAHASTPRIGSPWAETHAMTSATLSPLTPPSTAWPTPAACSGIPMSLCSSTERTLIAERHPMTQNAAARFWEGEPGVTKGCRCMLALSSRFRCAVAAALPIPLVPV